MMGIHFLPSLFPPPIDIPPHLLLGYPLPLPHFQPIQSLLVALSAGTFLPLFSHLLYTSHPLCSQVTSLFHPPPPLHFLPIQSLLVASSTGTFQETLTGLPNTTVDADRDSDLFCSIILMSSSVVSYKTRNQNLHSPHFNETIICLRV